MSHWYDRQGKCQYTIKGANGKVRDTTLADAKKFNLVPSVTTITSVLSKRMVDQWKQNHLIDAAYTMRSVDSLEDFSRQTLTLFKHRTEAFATTGSIVHDKLEHYFRTQELAIEDEDILWPVIEVINNMNPISITPEESFASNLGYGGKIDLIVQKKLDDTRKTPETIIIDFKTKQGDLSKVTFYDDYVMQLGAYRQAIDSTARCINIFISMTHDVPPKVKEWTTDEMCRGTKMFNSLLDYWKLANNFRGEC